MANTTKRVNKKMVKGLSNIVGSLLLIVITIVAALLIGHFVFGLFSSNSHNAGISISDASIIIPAGEYKTQGASISVTITDSGNDPVVLTTVNLIANGKAYNLYSGSSSTNAISPISGNYQTVQGKGLLIEPGQSVTLSGTITTSTQGFTGLQLQTGQTVVILASGVDNVTAQSVTQQVSVVIQD
ncbi:MULTISPECIES: archaellin/type IV pilin N-terminal domain-containing protein [unclassified Stygiolobus]|uniref:archaellin/type IV pilin N-terminal domain-containing protein n=1 Tax=unclassified Stygiolobus TaxID=2824672 RepID=UPI00307EF78C